MKWIEISLITERVAAEEVATLFSDYMDNGIIEEDVEEHPEQVKLTLYGNGNLTEKDVQEQVVIRCEENNIPYYVLTTSIVDDATWYNSWQQYIEPTEILPHMIIKPAWQDYKANDGEIVIEIDSDLSFGTGTHETTRSCAKLIAKYATIYKACNKLSGKKCLDIGTGTGILLLVAEKLGFTELVGIDIDEAATKQAKINCSHNRVDATIICGDLAQDFNDKADLILANLTVDPLKILLPIISNKLVKDGILIISGIIDDRYEEIMPFITANWQIKEEVVDRNWHSFALVAKS